MRIALASDHAGYGLKVEVAKFLAGLGIETQDFGSSAGDAVDYVDTGAAAAGALSRGEFERAILICGTGIGMAIVGNKLRGVRATPCWNIFTADMSRRHNDSNCLTLGGRTHAVEDALAIVRVWLETPFEGGRHARRVDKIRALDTCATGK
jgi:ribose 5-phosphate isomerase B